MKGKPAGNALHRTDSLIGAGMRVDGSLSFAGVLRIQGEVCGNIASATDAEATLVIDRSGSVTGAVEAPHVVVLGHLLGPIQSAATAEIHAGGSASGDIHYRSIAVHAGGIAAGTLIPIGLPDAVLPEHEAGHGADTSALAWSDPAALQSPLRPRVRTWTVAALSLAAVLAVAAWLRFAGEPAPAPAAETAQPAPAPAASGGPQQAAAGANGTTGAPRTAGEAAEGSARPAGTGAKSADASDAAAAAAGPAAAPEAGPPVPADLVVVRGVNPRKPAAFFQVASKGPSVLYRKQQQDPSEGVRIEIARGGPESIPIQRNEVVRVASGRDVEIFYQGRKVPQGTIARGAWISFVPQPAGAAE